MTALTKYARLEATALWRPEPNAQRREVVISVGDATLMVTDLRTNAALTHWSLAAIERVGSGLPAVYHPDGDPAETLEVSEPEMVEALETLRRAVERSRPHPGRLRWLGATLSVSAVIALGVFWLPGALHSHALRVLPAVKQTEIGTALLTRIARVGGAPCGGAGTEAGLRALAARTGVARVTVLPGGVSETLLLPGGTMLLNRSLLEDHEDPHVAAGYILAELTRRDDVSALSDLLDHAGLRGTASLLTTGQLPDQALDAYAEHALSKPRPAPSNEALLDRFQAARLPISPYAYALDISGETTLSLIEADPLSGQPTEPIMTDGDWVRLQSICET